MELSRPTFETLVWVSLVPAALAVAVLALGTREVITVDGGLRINV